MPHSKNTLLARLDMRTLDLVRPHLRVVELPQGEVIADTHQLFQKVYFPHSGIISCVVEMTEGPGIETAMIGMDGEFGAGPALDQKVSLNRAVVQVPGAASVIDANRLRETVGELPEFSKLLATYEQFFIGHIQQTAACNASHTVEMRMCKWLLRMHALVGRDLPLTQEFLAQMMGVRRTSVSLVAGDMQKAGLISYSRGRVRIEKLGAIIVKACECHNALESHYRLLFGGHDVENLSPSVAL